MKVRLAPAATGPVHVGSARVALAAWLMARRHGGRVVLRIDDADVARVDEAQAEAVAHDLAWLGLDWDETVRQSDRLARYELAAARLRESGRLYPCFESEEELAAKREQRQRRGLAVIYDRAMLKLTAEQRAAAEAGGKRPYWRFLLSGVPAEWGDMVLGRREVKLSAVEDPVLVRADGVVMPGLAGAVDDIELGITHVVRGEDQVTATGVQIDVAAALGVTVRTGGVRYAHLPVLADAQGGALTRRNGGLSLRALRGDGVEPAAVAGLLAVLGTSAKAEAAMPGALAPVWDLAGVGKASPRFDPRSLLKLNRAALGTLGFEDVRERLPPSATPAFWGAVRGSLDLLREARGWWDVVSGTIVPPLLEGEAAFLAEAGAALPAEPWDGGTFAAWVGALRDVTGRKGRALMVPLRLALTGEEQGPDLGELLPLMGRARVAERLRLAAA